MIIIALPAFNEEEALSRLLPDIATVLEEAGLPYRLLVVDDGSGDRTAAVVEACADQLSVKLVRHPRNLGLGAAMQTLFRTALADLGEGDILVTMDADETHRPSLIGPMVEKIHEGAEVVIASRYQPGAQIIGVPAHRLLLSNGMARLFRTLAPVRGAKDYSCGYRAYAAGILRRMAEIYGEGLTEESGFACQVDVLLKAGRLGAVVAEVPMILRYDLKPGKSKMNVRQTVRDTLRLLRRRGSRESRVGSRK
jgi:dolichol-phosphate mannosyltransferase